MQRTGYTPIEFATKTPLGSFCADPRHTQMALAILEFIRSEACRRLETDRIEVIQVEYLGAYPCLALRGGGGPGPSVARVLAEIDVILREASLGAFVEHLEHYIDQ